MNCYLQKHINLHILYIIQVKTSSKIQELSKFNKYIKSSQENMTEFGLYISIYVSFEFKVEIRFSGEPMTQYTRESRANVNHMRTWQNSSCRHPTSHCVELYHDWNVNPNVNPKIKCNCCEMSCESMR